MRSRPQMMQIVLVISVLLALFPSFVNAHIAAWAKGMYCINGTTLGVDNPNNDDAVNPLYNLTKSDWWFHHYDGCDQYPPAPGDFLELPAGGSFTVELAGNRAFTTLSYNGAKTSPWGDGQQHPVNYSINNLGGASISSSGCLSTPNLHAQNETEAAGTAFAIAYTSELAEVTPEDLVVFTVRYHTPYMRITAYDVPAALPKCPEGGCICAWGWVPNHCGQANMYMMPYRCNVTNPGTGVLAPAKPPVWCENDPSACTQGAKQMIYWNQRDGNNIITTGNQADGLPKSPAYNMKLGFLDGPQVNIFMDTSTVPPPHTNITTTVLHASTSSASTPRSTTAAPMVPPPAKPIITSSTNSLISSSHKSIVTSRSSSSNSQRFTTSQKPAVTTSHVHSAGISKPVPTAQSSKANHHHHFRPPPPPPHFHHKSHPGHPGHRERRPRGLRRSRYML